MLGAGRRLVALGIAPVRGGAGATAGPSSRSPAEISPRVRGPALAHRPPPALETSLWRSRTFAPPNLASLLYGAALFAWMLVGVLFLLGVWGYSPLEAGLAVTPGAVVASAVALGAGPSRGRPRAVSFAGALTLAVAGLGAARDDDAPGLSVWLPAASSRRRHGRRGDGISSAAALSVAPSGSPRPSG